ncbi:SDR family oxidoreductase [[Mycobacterium] burgundiense]|jgi:NAD(P)-dependent dehydrogenase (short-subunit alcohol dehydrogenase family)|uniref:SDR family oxidoreductase n=1 Tax=[Mycobacterium] burgundiense TaxID=3064286 RepID=A0ABN9NGT6_9MYCO|nr:SDR family oxidoreductase [Mycolicibacterium sp. MU0053]CAJ1506126.1 SDR family oxidoreductase [Mycolicibacterium sp. MU0053]
MQSDTSRRVALVTGASRGIGAEVARHLADADTHVVVNYRHNAAGADAVAQDIRSAGGHASTVAADVSDDAATTAMINDVAHRFGRLDALVLNASGGLEPDSQPNHAMRVNHDAQRRLARLALPLMPAGGHLVFATSHQAHFYPLKAVPKGYATVAASKRGGETALYAMRSQFDHRDIHFTVVSGDMIDGNSFGNLGDRPEFTAFAAAIARAATAPKPTGIVYVGGPDHLARMSA